MNNNEYMKRPQLENFIGRADCGCVYHAENGQACEHDKQLYDKALKFYLEHFPDEKQKLADEDILF